MNIMNRRVLLTGAGRGIGLSIAKKLVEQGYRLVLLVASETSAQELSNSDLVREFGSDVFAFNMQDRTKIGQFVEGWKEELWGIVNNAGICKTFDILANGNDPIDEILGINLIAPYLLTKGLLPHLSRPGRIVNIASQLGQEGRAGYSAYCASKFGLIGMTKCWAKELGCVGITVNAVCPGWVDTEMSFKDIERMAKIKNLSSDEYYKDICIPLELKRFNTTDEVANLVSFLLSDKASGITGRDWLMQTIWNQE